MMNFDPEIQDDRDRCCCSLAMWKVPGTKCMCQWIILECVCPYVFIMQLEAYQQQKVRRRNHNKSTAAPSRNKDI